MLITHTLDVTHHTLDNQTTNLTPHSSVHIQHTHVFKYTITETATTSHQQQQWVPLPSEGTSNTTCSMGVSCRWPGTPSGVQFAELPSRVRLNAGDSTAEPGGGGLELDACPHTCSCEILLRPFAEQTNFITVGTKTYSPRGVRTFDHALYNLPSVGVFPYKFGRRLIYAIFATW